MNPYICTLPRRSRILGYLLGYYATALYLPFSRFSDAFRDGSRRLRGKADPYPIVTSLPRCSWTQVRRRRAIFLTELEKNDGNVRISELGVLCQFARALQGEGFIFEIGTFDGRTTLNLALNAPGYQVITLDLPPEQERRYTVEPSEEQYIRKGATGLRFRQNRTRFPAACNRIHQVYGDSAAFDYGPYEGRCDLVFVDGSHAYEYAKKDSDTAFRLCRDGGTILWHDYGVWPNLTAVLEQIGRDRGARLKHIAGTSLTVATR